MFSAENERTRDRTPSFFDEPDLIQYLDDVSAPGDFWDIMKDGRLEYYYQPY